MALADFASTRSPAQSAAGALIRTTAAWFAARRARRDQEAALQSLMFAPEHRLRDLGIRREDLIQAMEIHRK